MVWFAKLTPANQEPTMYYSTPQLRDLGSLSYLTLGQNGSSPDGNSRNNTQLGGGNDGGNTQNPVLPVP